MALIVLIVFLIPTISSEMFKGKCPNFSTTPEFDVGINPQLTRAISVVPRESGPSDNFDFFIREQQIVMDDSYDFYVQNGYFSWNLARQPCYPQIALQLDTTNYVLGKDKLLISKYMESTLCKSDNNWPWMAILTDPAYPKLYLILGCRELNRTHSDLAIWVLLGGYASDDYKGENVEFYRNHSEHLLASAGLANFTRIRLLTDSDLLYNETIKVRPDCFPNMCAKAILSSQAKFNYSYIIWSILGLVVVVGIISTIKFMKITY